MIKLLSKLFAFFIAFINIFFFYLWSAVFYISTAISQIFTYIPILSFIGSLFSFLGTILGTLVLWVWLGMDYLIMFLRELVMPLLVSFFSYFKGVFLWIWEKILWFIHLFIPQCKPSEEWCLKFDKSMSYGIALLDPKSQLIQNRLYEKSIQEYFQEKLRQLYSKEKVDLVKMYNKARKSKRNSDMLSYNRVLNTMQVAELNIVNNYNMSINQHRLLLLRRSDGMVFDPVGELQTQALHLAVVSDKVVI